MAKRFRKTKITDDPLPPTADETAAYLTRFITWTFDSGAWVALLLAMVAFLVYRPSLTSDFVYDARKEILDEGYITSLSNLPSVLSLKVLNQDLMLGSRPGQMVYLMLNAALWGKEPFGYHLASNLLHAVNVAILFLLLVRLAKAEIGDSRGSVALKVQVAAAVATLIFALHPLAVESVSEVSYSSSLLVTFFTLLALYIATFFRAELGTTALLIGCLGTICAFLAVTSKESGITVALILIAYWFLFRRSDAKLPWLLFTGAALAVSVIFLLARFLFPPPADPYAFYYLGGSFSQVFLVQPCLWIFMMGKLLWPMQLSADYTVEDLNGLPTSFAWAILALVVFLQGWLARKSRLGALGVALYWSGLLTVSNFIPLRHPLADRYYYLPLAGLAMQLLALLLMTLGRDARFWLAVLPLCVALVPLSLLTVSRQHVFANDFSLWSDTIRASPHSETAHYGLGQALFEKGQVDQASIEYEKALQLDSHDYEAANALGIAFFQIGKPGEAIEQFRKVLEMNPNYSQAHYNLGLALLKNGQPDAAITEFQETLRLKADDEAAQSNLAQAEADKQASAKK